MRNMEPKPTELIIALTPEEAKALEKGLADLTFNRGTSDLKAWRAIQVKLKAAMHQENLSHVLGTT
jgi:hypothetical protein